MEPEKPFACSMPDCGMTFTNEDHLHVHTKKHDMVLQLGMGQKAAFVADQTPTPTRFIRNCEEVGLFQDLQNVAVNPFDEGFKRAMETKHGMHTLEGPSSNEDLLHTPHLVFPLESGDCTLYTANNQRNITISRSSSDESGAVKEYETTKISKLTNEVTTISRIVGKDDVSIVRHEEGTKNKDILNETSVSYTNNVIIHSNVEIRHDINIDTKKVANNNDSIIKDPLSIDGLIKFNDNNKLKDAPPIMSQKSLDFVVDSLTTEPVNREESLPKKVKRNPDNNDSLDDKDNSKRNVDNTNKVSNEKDKNIPKFANDLEYEVIIKLPNGKHVRMKAVDEIEKPISAKEKLKIELRNKLQKPNVSNPLPQNIVPISTGTLIPVTIVNPNLALNQTMNPTFLNQGLPIFQKIPIQPVTIGVKNDFKPVKRRVIYETVKNIAKDKCKETELNVNETDVCNANKCKETEMNVNEKDCYVRNVKKSNTKKNSLSILESHSAASKRYRERLKQTMQKQIEENINLRKMNRILAHEKAVLQRFITQHLKDCPNGPHLSRTLQEKLQSLNNCIHMD
ncbi:uncharacterized protein LOC123879163 isoform X3 [Maniola jurtina]|uniref:uncharacterized protein LOC123879163 isoform X2 n=1 Tax=Maniola jurtina TaxID=191418 RepID=UPI001E688BF1|nr:uncharacterized protein LOC123879163 isoform X2 [Maniola jurtina]XP_045782700.1 uncharacterized protein LOC123879163 isoform X3 [Maniola jurtina]